MPSRVNSRQVFVSSSLAQREPFEDSSLMQIVVKTRDVRASWDEPAMSLMTGRAAKAVFHNARW